MTQNNLSELFREAMKYGALHFNSWHDGTCQFSIEFNVGIEGDMLTVRSEVETVTPEEAVESAIDKARKLVEDFAKLNIKIGDRK